MARIITDGDPATRPMARVDLAVIPAGIAKKECL